MIDDQVSNDLERLNMMLKASPAPKVFVSGPYSAPSHQLRLANVKNAAAVGAALANAGYNPCVPILGHYMVEAGMELDWVKAMVAARDWLSLCDAVLVIGESTGVTVEIKWAKEMNIPVYKDIETLMREL